MGMQAALAPDFGGHPIARSHATNVEYVKRGGESDLLGRAQRGDQLAFSQILKENDRNMRGLAFNLLGSESAMDDALQDAYIKAYSKIGTFRGESAVGTWLYQIVYRTCLDHLRKNGRRSEVSLHAVPDRADVAPGAEQQVSTSDELQRALNSLSPEHKAAVLLVDGEGLSYEEAASVLDTAPGTVASRLSRARKTLRSALKTSEKDR